MTSVRARLTEILPAAAAAVGSPLNESLPWELPAAEAYVIALIDGMGEVLIREHPEETPFLSSLAGIPAISEIPSTTATSLTSFGCALPPTQHGVVGYTSRIPGTDRLLNALNWDRNLDPEEWQPLPTAFERLARAGVAASVVGAKDYESSGLTSVSQRGADYLAADRFGERLAQTVRASRHSPSITYYYDSDLDWVGHRHGVDSPEWRAQLRLIDTSLEQLRAALPDNVKMLITADHGMVDTTRGRQLDVDAFPELRQGVDLIGGEARFRYLYCDPDLAPNVVRRWQNVISDEDATILTFEDAQAAGWFGEVDQRIRPRFGDVVVATVDNFAVLSSRDNPREFDMIGLHGSITDRERLIPLLLA